MDALEIQRIIDLEDKHWWYQERRFLIAQFVRALVPGRALDVGAAGGGNSRTLQSLGWSVSALELSETGSVAAHSRGLPAIRADARFLPCPSGSVDLVLSFDVLEHIEEDTRAAREFARVLRPGGSALISVPADPRLWSAHDEAVGHVRRYTRAEFEALLTDAGFTIDSVRSWNVLLRPLAAVHRRRSIGSDLAPVRPALNAVLRTTVAFERVLPVGRFSGVSLLAQVRL